VELELRKAAIGGALACQLHITDSFTLELGQIVATPGALAALRKAEQQPGEFLTRHVNRAWCDLSDEDRKENDYSLEHGFRLLSAYRTHTGDKLWIITESDRFVTTLLSPEEY
jgi:hypothetical protein